ncbi:MAG: hypothetical protein R6V07_20170 [Armatimonadota bacterium]
MHRASPVLTVGQLRRCILIALGITGAAYAGGICVNSGPSMNGLGWIYVTSWGAVPDAPGQIVRFAPPQRPAWTRYLPRCTLIKRVVGTDEQGRLIYEGDSTEYSADCRDGLAAVPPENVAGVIVAAISPRRLLRLLTRRGRLENHVEFSYAPKRRMRFGDGYVVAGPDGLRELTVSGERPLDPEDARLEAFLQAGDYRRYNTFRRFLSNGPVLATPPSEQTILQASCALATSGASRMTLLAWVDRNARVTLSSGATVCERSLSEGGHLVGFPVAGDRSVISVYTRGDADYPASISVDAVILDAEYRADGGFR